MKSKIDQIKDLLRDDLYDSKDWKDSDVVGRIEWLISMYESVKEEKSFLEGQLESEVHMKNCYE